MPRNGYEQRGGDELEKEQNTLYCAVLAEIEVCWVLLCQEISMEKRWEFRVKINSLKDFYKEYGRWDQDPLGFISRNREFLMKIQKWNQEVKVFLEECVSDNQRSQAITHYLSCATSWIEKMKKSAEKNTADRSATNEKNEPDRESRV